MLAARSARASPVLAVLLCGCGVLLLYAGRHLTFFYDEWSFILQRRGGGVDTYLNPHNGHLVLFSVIIYKLLFALGSSPARPRAWRRICSGASEPRPRSRRPLRLGAGNAA